MVSRFCTDSGLDSYLFPKLIAAYPSIVLVLTRNGTAVTSSKFGAATVSQVAAPEEATLSEEMEYRQRGRDGGREGVGGGGLWIGVGLQWRADDLLFDFQTYANYLKLPKF